MDDELARICTRVRLENTPSISGTRGTSALPFFLMCAYIALRPILIRKMHATEAYAKTYPNQYFKAGMPSGGLTIGDSCSLRI